jgi:hypothetical protein
LAVKTGHRPQAAASIRLVAAKSSEAKRSSTVRDQAKAPEKDSARDRTADAHRPHDFTPSKKQVGAKIDAQGFVNILGAGFMWNSRTKRMF